MKSPNENFMRHFRWLTPLLLALSVFLLQDIYFDFKKLKTEVTELEISMAVMKTLATARRFPRE